MMTNRKLFGWHRELPDQRDFKYALHEEFQGAATLPPVVDLRQGMSSVEDQGSLGSCVANATAGQLELLQLRAIKDKENSPTVFNSEFSDISRLFIYFNARYLDGTSNRDDGTYIRSAIMSLRRWGICQEKIWPYDQGQVFNIPSRSAYSQGSKHKVFAGYRLDHTSELQLKLCLAKGYPFIFGISLYETFMSNYVAKTGLVPKPSPNERLVGGHAMLCVGYDATDRTYLVRNSWGIHWGMSGYCKIPMEYLHGALAADFWTIRKEVRPAGEPGAEVPNNVLKAIALNKELKDVLELAFDLIETGEDLFGRKYFALLSDMVSLMGSVPEAINGFDQIDDEIKQLLSHPENQRDLIDFIQIKFKEANSDEIAQKILEVSLKLVQDLVACIKGGITLKELVKK